MSARILGVRNPFPGQRDKGRMYEWMRNKQHLKDNPLAPEIDPPRLSSRMYSGKRRYNNRERRDPLSSSLSLDHLYQVCTEIGRSINREWTD